MESLCSYDLIGDLYASKDSNDVYFYVSVMCECDCVCVCDSSFEGRPDLSLGEMWAQAPVPVLLDWVQPSSVNTPPPPYFIYR